MTYSEREYQAYQKSLMSYRDMVNVMQTKFEEGVEQGIEVVAVRCLKQGKSLKEICEITGLTAEQVKIIRDKIRQT